MIVIAISAPPGAGKTVLAHALAAKLPGALAIEHDHYEAFTSRSPREIEAWLNAGGAYDEVDVSALVADIEALKAGRDILDRSTGQRGRAERFIVVETPFGSAHPAMREHIDFEVWVEIPADLALARRLSEFVQAASGDPSAANLRQFVGWLDGYLQNYINIVRRAIAIQRTRVAREADFALIDQDANVADQVKAVMLALKARGLLKPAPGGIG